MLITPIQTYGMDASETVVSYSATAAVGATLITDLRSIKSVIGRFESQGRWTIVDRSKDEAQAKFADGDANESDSDADE